METLIFPQPLASYPESSKEVEYGMGSPSFHKPKEIAQTSCARHFAARSKKLMADPNRALVGGLCPLLRRLTTDSVAGEVEIFRGGGAPLVLFISGSDFREVETIGDGFVGFGADRV